MARMMKVKILNPDGSSAGTTEYSVKTLLDLKNNDPEGFKRVQIQEDDKVAAGLRGAAQGATFGFSDELTGAGEALLRKLTGDKRPIGDLYTKSRDEAREANAAAEMANPKTYTGSELGGAFLVPIPGSGMLTGASKALVKGAPTAIKYIVPGAIHGAAAGGMFGAGTSNADLTKGEVGKFAGDVAKGTATGAGAGTVVAPLAAGASKLLGRGASKAGEVADVAAAEAVGGPGAGLPPELGKIARQRGVVPKSAAEGDVSRAEENAWKLLKRDESKIKPPQMTEEGLQGASSGIGDIEELSRALATRPTTADPAEKLDLLKLLLEKTPVVKNVTSAVKNAAKTGPGRAIESIGKMGSEDPFTKLEGASKMEDILRNLADESRARMSKVGAAGAEAALDDDTKQLLENLKRR